MPIENDSQYSGFHRPGIRLTEPLDPELTALRPGRIAPMVYALHMFDKAHVVMLTEEGLIPRADGSAILRALRTLEQEGVDRVRAGLGGDLHAGEAYLIRTLGEGVGGRMHLGRSSGDLSTVGLNIRERDRLLALMRGINDLRAVLLTQGREHAAVVMPGYTFLQHAQPVTLGHTYTAWAATLARDFERARGAYGRVNRSAAGAAIMTGSDFPLNRARSAELLGFDRAHENTQDAILELTPDDFFETFAVVAILHANLARWAEDLTLWTTSEFGFLEVPDRFCGTSSIMSQKRNFLLPLEIKGAAAAALGGLVTMFHGLKGSSGTPVSERYYGVEGLWEAFDTAERSMRWLGEYLPLARPNAALMRERAGAFWATVTDVAGALVRERDLPWRTAHQIVGIFVRRAVERGLRPTEVTTELLDEAAIEYRGTPVGLDALSLRAALDPERFVRARTLYGGPAPEQVRERIAEMEGQLAADRREVETFADRLAKAAAKLEAAIDRIVSHLPNERWDEVGSAKLRKEGRLSAHPQERVPGE
jgi:argininosuccinate lyase